MASNIFMKLGDIKGESVDDKHKNEIEVLSFSWGLTNPSPAGLGGGGAGKVVMQDFHFVKKSDTASPALMLSCASGKHIDKAIIVVRKAGGEQQVEYIKIQLQDLLVSSFEQKTDSENDAVDTFTLSFKNIQFDETSVTSDSVIP